MRMWMAANGSSQDLTIPLTNHFKSTAGTAAAWAERMSHWGGVFELSIDIDSSYTSRTPQESNPSAAQ
jgi:hypothetical protein